MIVFAGTLPYFVYENKPVVLDISIHPSNGWSLLTGKSVITHLFNSKIQDVLLLNFLHVYRSVGAECKLFFVLLPILYIPIIFVQYQGQYLYSGPLIIRPSIYPNSEVTVLLEYFLCVPLE